MSDFFDKVGDAFEKGGKKFSDKAKQVSDVTKTQMDIKKAKDALAEKYIVLGKLYFEEHKDDSVEEVQSVAAAKQQIEILEKQLAVLKGEIKCPVCGAMVPAEYDFCPKCGAKIEKPAPAEEAAETTDEAEKVDGEVVDE